MCVVHFMLTGATKYETASAAARIRKRCSCSHGVALGRGSLAHRSAAKSATGKTSAANVSPRTHGSYAPQRTVGIARIL